MRGMPWARRVVACDDGAVRKLGTGYTLVVCVSWPSGGGLPSVMAGWVRVDGLDASSIVAYMVSRLRGHGLDLVLLDSITIAGFNIVSPASVYRLTGVPVAVLYKYRPSLDRLSRAVRNVPLHEIRLRALRLVDRVAVIRTRRGVLYSILWGVDDARAREIIEDLQVHGRVPEPLRLAHYLASSLSGILNPDNEECFNFDG